VQQLDQGQALSLWLNPAHIYVFDAEGRLAAPAAYAAAA
jgi:glycerol transport system ATP-binding protein